MDRILLPNTQGNQSAIDQPVYFVPLKCYKIALQQKTMTAYLNDYYEIYPHFNSVLIYAL